MGAVISRNRIQKLCIIAAAFACICGVMYYQAAATASRSVVFSDADHVTLSILTGDGVLETTLWRAENGAGYFFLPSCADLADCCFLYDDTDCSLELGEKEIAAGTFLSAFRPEVPYAFRFRDRDGTILQDTVTFLQSAGLPAVYLQTEDAALDYVHADKENKAKASMTIVDASGKIVYRDAIAYIKGHGNTSWTDQEKKPYLLKLKEPFPLLGMGSGNKWILLANAYDPSYIRNSLVYDLAQSVGLPYTSQLRYVDLYINGEYRGNYQLAEKIDVGSGRVDINNLQKENEKVNPPDYRENPGFRDDTGAKGIADMENPADITGGYLLERNRGKRYGDKTSGFVTWSGEPFVVRSPSYASREEVAYIAEVTQHVENAILAVDGIDPDTGLFYTELLDETSFVRKYLLEEITLNEASGSSSSWFYKPENKRSSKLFAGPVWDYDKALGHPEMGSFRDPCVLSKIYCYHTEYTKWFYALYQKESFLSGVKAEYQERFRPALVVLTDEKIDRYVSEIRESAAMDQIRWHKTDDLDACAEDIREWTRQRMAFLDRVWLAGEPVCLIRYMNNRGGIRAFASVFPGGSLKNAPVIETDDAEYLYVYREDTGVELLEGTDIPSDHITFFCWYDAEGGQTYGVGADSREVWSDITLYPVYMEND